MRYLSPQMNIAKSICHATSVTARTSKAFSNQNSMQDCGCVQLYLDAMQLFISCLNVSNDTCYSIILLNYLRGKFLKLVSLGANVFFLLILTFSSLQVGVEREMVGSGVRQLMHRLVVCLDGRSLMPLLPPASQALLHTPSPTILTEYLPLINQTITKFQVLKWSQYIMDIFAIHFFLCYLHF